MSRSGSESLDFDYDRREYDFEGEASTLLAGASRLSRFKRPKISEIGQQKAMHKAMKGKTKAKRKSRNSGILARLMDMPLDVFFEIASQLHPLDILHLSRVSKQFRVMFASRNSRHIWVAARRNVPGDMPACPSDMSEPQYASLMFEHHCQACGTSGAQKTDYALRVRFCGSCFKENIQKRSKLKRSYRQVPDIIFTLLPHSMLKTPGHYANASQNAYYYAPEFEMVLKRYGEVKPESTALKAFMRQQIAIASRMMKDATAIGEWVMSCKQRKAIDDQTTMENREASIMAKLLELGWDEKEFPTGYDGEWITLVRQPRELTPRIWKLIRPKLEAILRRNKEKEYRARCADRRREFHLMWTKFIATMPSPEQRAFIPHQADALELPSIAAMLYESDATIPVTEERWLASIDSIQSQVEMFQTNVRRDIRKQLQSFKQQSTRSFIPLVRKTDAGDATAEDVDSDLHDDDFSVLDKASTLFSCGRMCTDLFGYAAIFDHRHFHNLKWMYMLPILQHKTEAEPVVRMVLKVLNLPEDTPLTAMEQFNGQLICLCGHPNFRKPTTFLSLIRHIMDENNWYESYELARIDNVEIDNVEFHNDHSLTSAEPLIAVLSSNDLVGCDDESNSDKVSYEDFYYDSRCIFCRYCCFLKLSLHHRSLHTNEEAVYHMRVKHNKEMVDDDVVDFTTMKQLSSLD